MRDWINDTIAEILADTSQRFMKESSGFNTLAKYDTGTATVTKGSTTVTLSGASLDSTFIGRKFYISNHAVGYPITAVSDPALTLEWPYMKDSGSGLEYQIVKDIYGLAADFDRPKVVDQHFTNFQMTVLENVPTDFKISDRPMICTVLDSDPSDASTLMALQIYPAPDRVMRITYDYYRKYTKLTTDSSTISIPDEFVSAICFGVARLYWMTQGESRISIQKTNQFDAAFERSVRKIRETKYRDDAKLVQFIPYDQPGVSNPAGEWDDWHPAGLI
jgi:hypothetical protein